MNYKHLKIKLAYKQMLISFITISIIPLLITGCQSEQKVSNHLVTENSQVTNNDSTVTESNINEVTSSEAEDGSKESPIIFTELSKYQFVFSSGVGAWQTMLNINEDGTFYGVYSDSEMGNIGEDYPQGTVYFSKFEGKFTTPKKVNEYTYSMTIEYIKLENEIGSEEIIDGIKYIYSEPYGINDAKEIYIYTPEAPIKELPEGFRNWVGYPDLNNVEDEYLPFYGLYNVETESGFSSYKLPETKENN